ncbi:Nicotinamide/nicotinic acid mononucleotide adenylyltransferase 2 [Actinomortierella ambigua]|nr:Nicotinamide/nicotinic acid mononucleotide adenylyltransferase 2 [Actinomortierella ambigua]
MLAIHASAAYPLQDNDSLADLGRRTPSSTAASTAASVSRLHHHLQQQRLDRNHHHHSHNHNHHHNHHSLPSPSTALTVKEFFLHRRQHALHAQQLHGTHSHPHQRSLSHPHQRTITTTTTTTTTTTASDFDLFSLQQHHRLHTLHLHQQQQFEQLQHHQAYHHASLHSSPATASSHIVHSNTPTLSAADAAASAITTTFTPTTSTAATTALRASVPTVVAPNQHSATATATATATQPQQQRTSQKPTRPFLLPNNKRRHPNHLHLVTNTATSKTQTASPPSSPTTTAAMTPTAKIEARMARLDSDDLAKEKIVVLLTGSFCPVHLQHTEILEAAKREIEASGNSVVLGGFLSPSHDSYVGAKLWREALVLNSDQRIALCQAQTQGSDWIDVDRWEANQEEFYDYYEVARRLERHLNALFQGALAFQIHQKQQLLQATHSNHTSLQSARSEDEVSSSLVSMPTTTAATAASNNSSSPLENIPRSHQQYMILPDQQHHNYALQQASRIRVVYLCGADFVVRTGARDLTSGMVVVDRPVDASPTSSTFDSQEQAQEPPTVKEQVYRKLEQRYGREWCDPSNNNLWFLPSRSLHPSDDVSSTRIRRLLGKRESCDGLLHPAVMALLEQWLKNSVPASQNQADYW